MARIIRTLIWIAFIGIILYAFVMFALMGTVAKVAEDVTPDAIYQARFPDNVQAVDMIGGGGESWLESDVWLAFRHTGFVKPDFLAKLGTCDNANEIHTYFQQKVDVYGVHLPETEMFQCFQIVNPNDPTLAGRWLMHAPKSGIHLYREWSRGRKM